MGLKDIAKKIGLKLIQPLMEKQHTRVTWWAYGKWRTFVNKDGRITTRRYRQQPKGVRVVRNVKDAIEYARESWGVEIDRRGMLPEASPIKPPAAMPIYREPIRISRRFKPLTRHTIRITPRRPALRR